MAMISGLRPLSPLWCLRHHLPPAVRWDNKAPLNIFFISSSKYSTGCCAPACGGKVVAPATKGGCRRQAAFIMAPQGAVPPQSVSRLKGRPLIGQARGQLRLTCVSHAGYAQSGTI